MLIAVERWARARELQHMSASAKAALVFIVTTVSIFVGLSGVMIGWLWLNSADPEGFGLAALLILLPSLSFFAISAIFIGLWTSHRTYRHNVGVADASS